MIATESLPRASVVKRFTANGVICVEEPLKTLGQKPDRRSILTRSWVKDGLSQELVNVCHGDLFDLFVASY